jgi:hypothetical protein
MPSQTWGLHPAVQLIPPAIAARESCCPSNQNILVQCCVDLAPTDHLFARAFV